MKVGIKRPGYDGENPMVLRSLVLSQYQRVTDRQTDEHAAYRSRDNIAERDKVESDTKQVLS